MCIYVEKVEFTYRTFEKCYIAGDITFSIQTHTAFRILSSNFRSCTFYVCCLKTFLIQTQIRYSSQFKR